MNEMLECRFAKKLGGTPPRPVKTSENSQAFLPLFLLLLLLLLSAGANLTFERFENSTAYRSLFLRA